MNVMSGVRYLRVEILWSFLRLAALLADDRWIDIQSNGDVSSFRSLTARVQTQK